jgi:hypothetical protein
LDFGLTSDWGPVMTKTDMVPEVLYESAIALQSDIFSGKVKPVHDTACPK